eukprot:scaffold3328_cov195-Ochromonas_danica.AAC.1
MVMRAFLASQNGIQAIGELLLANPGLEDFFETHLLQYFVDLGNKVQAAAKDGDDDDDDDDTKHKYYCAGAAVPDLCQYRGSRAIILVISIMSNHHLSWFVGVKSHLTNDV